MSSFLIRSELLRDNAGDRVSKFWMLTGGNRKADNDELILSNYDDA